MLYDRRKLFSNINTVWTRPLPYAKIIVAIKSAGRFDRFGRRVGISVSISDDENPG